MATEAFTAVITRTPRKLNTAAITMAFRALMALVETQVAIAFGASVQPLTRITPSVKTVDTISIGLWHICSQNSGNPIVIPRLSVLNFGI